MRKKRFLLLILLVILFIIFTKYNGALKSFLLDFINPIKIAYLRFTNISDSYLKQQENILKLQKENNKLKKLLIEQSNYIEQLSDIYKLLPSLAKKPYKSIYLTDTISYVKLNRLNEVILTTPKNFTFKNSKPYGLMQDDVAAGMAQYSDGKLYGYLLSNPKCTFSVFIGEDKINGIAQGDNKDGMIIKFIPRWSKIQIGDAVKTSGLDSIFFPNIVVGVVTDIKTLDRYKEAKIKVYANLSKPSTFFLISDPTPYITTDYTPNTSFPTNVYPFIKVNKKESVNSNTTQTKDNIVEPESIKEEEYQELFNSKFIWQKRLDIEEEPSKNRWSPKNN